MGKNLLEHQIRGIWTANLKALRKTRGLTQSELADKLGINMKCIGSWEEQRAFPQIEHLIKIADLFKINLRDMLTKKVMEGFIKV